MKCWHCQTELIWGGDHDVEDSVPFMASEYLILTNLHCPNYKSSVDVWFPRDDSDSEK